MILRYGSVPILVSHDAQKSVAVFWLNPSEMYIDVSDGSDPVVCDFILAIYFMREGI